MLRSFSLRALALSRPTLSALSRPAISRTPLPSAGVEALFRPSVFSNPLAFTVLRALSTNAGEGELQPPGVILPHPNVRAPMSTDKDSMKQLKRFKPVTPGLRMRVMVRRDHLWKGRPIRKLTKPVRKTGGRGNKGQICVRHIGGGHKRRYRIIDFQRSILDMPGTIQRFEYDPNRSAWIALVAYPNGQLQYILAPQDVQVGDTVIASRTKEVDIRVGNAMPIAKIPVGTIIHNVELHPGKGGQFARAAGTYCQLLEKNYKPGYALIRTPSKEHRLVLMKCMATIGAVSNPLHMHEKLGKAGRSRNMGIRPTVRGVAMNPIDHPHGGGEGRGGPGRPSCSPTGVLAKGFKTRKRRNPTNKYIILRRPGGPRSQPRG